MSELERLIVDMKESLEREIQALAIKTERGFGDLRTRFDTQAARLDRQERLSSLEDKQ
jgi:hypothetical protein